jgi:hypothetical protein
MKIILIVASALTFSACTTLKTYDSNGNMIRECKIYGFPMPMNAHCDGNTNTTTNEKDK